MQNRSLLVFGIVLIAVGALFLLGGVLRFNAWDLFWPLALVGLGVWFLFRPRFTGSNLLLIGDIKRSGPWQVAPEEFVTFVGDINLDLTTALVPPGETVLICSGFVGDITLITPPGLGVKVTSTAFVTDIKFLGSKTSTFLNAATQATPDYATAERKIHLQARYFVGDIKVKAG